MKVIHPIHELSENIVLLLRNKGFLMISTDCVIHTTVVPHGPRRAGIESLRDSLSSPNTDNMVSISWAAVEDYSIWTLLPEIPI